MSFPCLLCILIKKACISVLSSVLLHIHIEWKGNFEVALREQQKSKRRPTLFLTHPHAVWMMWLWMPLNYLHPNNLHGPHSCREGKGHRETESQRGFIGSSVFDYFHSHVGSCSHTMRNSMEACSSVRRHIKLKPVPSWHNEDIVALRWVTTFPIFAKVTML